LKRAAGGFAPTKEHDFAAGSPKDPYGFKPTDVVVQRDGALMVSDWCDGQRPKRGRGRIYRITPEGKSSTANLPDPEGFAGLGKAARWEDRLNSPAHHIRVDAQTKFLHFGRKTIGGLDEALKQGKLQTRGRLHAVWIFAQLEGPDAIPRLLEIARNDPDARVRGQAIRAIADLADPVLREHRLDAGRGDPKLARHLVAADGLSSSVLLETVIALGRLRWADAPGWFQRNGLASPLLHEHALVHAMQQTLRRADNWPEVLKLLDLPEKYTLRTIALRALADQPEAMIVDGLIERLANEKSASRRREYADLLTRVSKKPGPWVYWNYRPAPRTPNSVAWDRTEAIDRALEKMLADPDHEVRLAVLKRMQRERIPVSVAALGRWLGDDTDEKRIGAIFAEFRLRSATEQGIVEPLSKIVPDKKYALATRREALKMLIGRMGDYHDETMLHFAGKLEDGPLLADALRILRAGPKSKPVFLAKIDSRDPATRAAAVFGLGRMKAPELTDRLPKLLADPEPSVRAAAAFCAGQVRVGADGLLDLTKDAEPTVRKAAFDALTYFPQPRAVPLAVAALNDAATRESALRCLGRSGGPQQAKAVVEMARHHPSAEILPLAVSTLWNWTSRANDEERSLLERNVAELQGSSGTLVHWHLRGPATPAELQALADKWKVSPKEPVDRPTGPGWQTALGWGTEARIAPSSGPHDKQHAWLAFADVAVAEPLPVQFLGGSNSPIKIWLNGKLVFERPASKGFVADADRFEATLAKGPNRLLVQLGEATDAKRDPEFHLRFRRKIAAANHEQLMQAALAKPGNAERGKKLFQDVAKSQCLKCHRLGDQGEKIGPDLTGVGNRFARVYLIESILEPNRTIAPSYETLQVHLQDGRVLNGVRMAETPDALTLGDTKGDKHVIARKHIDELRPLAISTMPDGLERGLSADDFVDLIAFLASQK
jgi:putative heme-binding domain-containing protein